VIVGFSSYLLAASATLAQRPDAPVLEMGDLNGAPFRIDIPEGWNGGLVLWVHGYTPVTQHPRTLETGAGANVSHAMNSLGFATAISWWSRGGWALREATFDTEALRQYFVRKYGPTEPTILAGSHLGGHVVYSMIERFPEVYDGAIAGTMSGEPSLMLLKERVFDMRLLYDHLFPGIPGSVVDFPAGADTWRLAEEHAKRTVAEKKDLASWFCTRVNVKRVELLPYIIGEYSETLRELRDRAGGNAFDNRNTIYTLYDDAGKNSRLNQELPRFAADAPAAEYLRRWVTPTGRLSRPLLAFNKIADEPVPPEHSRYYDVLTQIEGTNHLFVQMYTDRVAGASYTGAELRTAMKLLLRWIREGVRPVPGRLDADPDYVAPSGC
jgi:hypothetical protein